MPATGKWVDFKLVKESVPITEALEHYGVLGDLREKGDQLTGCCPLHKGSNSRQFSVSTTKNAFQCFSGDCGAKGNVLDLVAAMEGGISVRDAGLLLMERFPDRFGGDTPTGRGEQTPAKDDPLEEPEQTGDDTDESGSLFNKPLSFELQLDPEHEYLVSRGLTPETIQHFELGFCNRGSMKGRIAIPIHNGDGELAAYAGRWVGDSPPEDEGKYKLPAGFHKSLEVYNLHRVPRDARQVIVVEGFFSVHWLHQNGWPNVVSLMGSTLSEVQLKVLVERFKGVRLFLDGDEAGREAAEELVSELAKHTWVRNSQCPDGLQPDRLPAHELANLLR